MHANTRTKEINNVSNNTITEFVEIKKGSYGGVEGASMLYASSPWVLVVCLGLRMPNV